MNGACLLFLTKSYSNYSDSAELMKNSLTHQGAEIAKTFFGKKSKRKGNKIKHEFDFEEQFEMWNDRQLTIYMGDELQVYEDESEPCGDTLDED